MYWRLLGSLPLIDSDAAGAAASAAAEAAKAEATEAAAREAAARAAAEGRSPPAPPRPPQETPPPPSPSASAASAAGEQQLVSPPGVDASAALRWLGEAVYFPTALLPTASSSSSSGGGGGGGRRVGSLRWEPVRDHAARAVLVVAAPCCCSFSRAAAAAAAAAATAPLLPALFLPRTSPSRPPLTVSAVFHFGPGRGGPQCQVPRPGQAARGRDRRRGRAHCRVLEWRSCPPWGSGCRWRWTCGGTW